MNPFATTAATARGCSINYEPRAFTRLPTYPATTTTPSSPSWRRTASTNSTSIFLSIAVLTPAASFRGEPDTHRRGDSCSESEASDSYNRGNSYSKSYLSLILSSLNLDESSNSKNTLARL